MYRISSLRSLISPQPCEDQKEAEQPSVAASLLSGVRYFSVLADHPRQYFNSRIKEIAP
jgi:hypothetical protein